MVKSLIIFIARTKFGYNFFTVSLFETHGLHRFLQLTRLDFQKSYLKIFQAETLKTSYFLSTSLVNSRFHRLLLSSLTNLSVSLPRLVTWPLWSSQFHTTSSRHVTKEPCVCCSLLLGRPSPPAQLSYVYHTEAHARVSHARVCYGCELWFFDGFQMVFLAVLAIL